jgi:hypothetical protein
MAAMSAAMIIYALFKGETDDFSKKTMVILAIGVSLCLLSYYNAYGVVLIAVVWFLAHFISRKEYKKMWKKFGFTTVLVCIMAGWWFIRSGILYNGDILGLSARWELAVKEAEPQFSPLTKQTYAGQGRSLPDMLLSDDYLKTVYRSFICVMGNFDIQTADIVYHIDKFILAVSVIFAVMPLRPSTCFVSGRTGTDTVMGNRRRVRFYAEILLFADIVITVLLHMIYSYAYDWQPQGRYLLPMLVPLMYFLTLGFDKAGRLVSLIAAKINTGAGSGSNHKIARTINVIVRIAVMVYITVVLVYTLKVKVLPLYFDNADFKSYIGMTWQQVIPEFMQK